MWHPRISSELGLRTICSWFGDRIGLSNISVWLLSLCKKMLQILCVRGEIPALDSADSYCASYGYVWSLLCHVIICLRFPWYPSPFHYPTRYWNFSDTANSGRLQWPVIDGHRYHIDQGELPPFFSTHDIALPFISSVRSFAAALYPNRDLPVHTAVIKIRKKWIEFEYERKRRGPCKAPLLSIKMSVGYCST